MAFLTINSDGVATELPNLAVSRGAPSPDAVLPKMVESLILQSHQHYTELTRCLEALDSLHALDGVKRDRKHDELIEKIGSLRFGEGLATKEDWLWLHRDAKEGQALLTQDVVSVRHEMEEQHQIVLTILRSLVFKTPAGIEELRADLAVQHHHMLARLDTMESVDLWILFKRAVSRFVYRIWKRRK